MKVIQFDEPTYVGRNGDQGIVYRCVRKALLVSEPHWKLPNGAWSGGGPFYVVKETLSHTGGSVLVVYFDSGGTYKMYGAIPGPTRLPLYAAWAAGLQPWSQRRAELDAQFATGYKRTRPGNPVASVGQFLIELKDLPAVPFKRALQGGTAFRHIPRIALKELLDFRNLGSEYLNIVFGWKPFVSDLRKMYNLWHEVDKRMAQIIRENGKNIRRRSGIANEKSVVSQSSGLYQAPFYNCRGAPPNWTVGSTQWSITETAERRSWYAGSFRYYIPDVSSSEWNRRARYALFGASPTPELLWEVLPWSWLIDWFSNVGDVVSNASDNAVDNLTSNYGFVMETIDSTRIYQADVKSKGLTACMPWICYGGSWGGSCTTIHKKVTKSRSGSGNPFGLGVKLGDLTGYQLGILAALGISRSKVK